jgi:RHS repeat-associated protein
MTDPGGNVVWRADYLPFGEENLTSGTLENDFRFVGKENDKETGLYYFGARYVEAMIGRFISPDPLGAVDPRTGGINEKVIVNPQRVNLYAYGLNNPNRYIDPDGNEDLRIGDLPRLFQRDPLGLLPPMPSPETIREIGQGADRSSRAIKAAEDAAKNAADAIRLKKSLAGEQQTKEVGEPFAGAGTPKKLKEADRLSNTYGGNPNDWSKMSSSSCKAPDGTQIETHWYENIRTGERVEPKTVITYPKAKKNE